MNIIEKGTYSFLLRFSEKRLRHAGKLNSFERYLDKKLKNASAKWARESGNDLKTKMLRMTPK